MSDFLEILRDSAQKRILYLPHAVQQMLRPERMITVDEVEKVIFNGELIEDYPNDPRGHSCLLFGRSPKDRVIHVVCAPKNEYLVILTAYIPNLKEWFEDFKRRRK